MTPKPWQNSEGYNDPTAYAAMQSISNAEAQEAQDRCSALIQRIKADIKSSGFDLLERIQLRDRKTGRRFL